MLLKKVLSFSLFALIVFVSCERTDCCEQILEMSGRFVHEISNCDTMNNPEINCTEWMEFINDTEVDLLYGGNDIVQRFGYSRSGNVLELEGPLTSSFRGLFEIKDDKTLVRKDTKDIWKKVE